MSRLLVTGHALSELQIRAPEPDAGLTDDPWRVVLARWNGRALNVPDDTATAEALARALNDLSNGLEEQLRYDELPDSERKPARAASQAFGSLAAHVWRLLARRNRPPFDVGESVIYRSPATGDAVPVTFRGLSDSGAVVILNGWQVTVDPAHLARPVST